VKPKQIPQAIQKANAVGRQIIGDVRSRWGVGGRKVLIEQAGCAWARSARQLLANCKGQLGGFDMGTRSSFAQMNSEQEKLTESWKAEGRLSEAWVVADPEIVEIFSAGVAFGQEVGRRGRSAPAYSPDEWRKALREAIAKAADMEGKLERAREAMQKKD
jgi:hypothetical protein